MLWKKISGVIAVTLAACMMFSMFSCSGNNGGGSGTTAAGGGTAAVTSAGPSAETTTLTADAVLSSLPDADYGGYDFKEWTSNWANSTLEIQQAPGPALTGEPINDALFQRDAMIESKYNIKIDYTIIDDYSAMTSQAKKSVMAGDNAFDIVIGDMQNVTSGLAQTGAIYDFNTVPNVDLSKPWWSKYATRDLTIDGKFYFPTGDITPRFILSPYLLLFNKQLFQNYGLDYPYQQVLDGTWTIDAFSQLIKGQYQDLNGNGKVDTLDQFGLSAESETAYAMYKGCGESMVTIQNGNPVIALGTADSYTVLNKLAQILSSNDCYVDPQYQSYKEQPAFLEGRAMFIGQTATNLSMFRDMNYDYGILPMPKLDANQDSYYSYAQPWGAVAVAIPKTNLDINRTGMIVEALAAVGKYTSTPAEYDVTLKTKFTRDDYSAQMLDIITENATYDFGPIYDWGGNYNKLIDSMFKNQDFTSAFASTQTKMQTALDKTVAAFEAASNG